MRSLRRPRLHLVVSLALITAASACAKGSGAGGTGAGSAAGARVVDDLEMIPADADIVGALDLAGLRTSPSFAELGAPMLAKATEKLSAFKQACGFDPWETVKNLTFGIKILDEDRGRGSVVVHTSAPREQIKACLERSKTSIADTTIRIEGDIAYFASKKGDGFVALTFVGSDGVVAMVNDTEWTAEKVKAVLAGTGGIKSSQGFTDLRGTIKEGQTMWIFLNGASKIAEQLKSIGLAASGYIGSVLLTDGLTAELRIRMSSPEAARTAAETLKGQLQMAEMVFTKLDARAEGSDYHIDAALSASQLKALMRMAGHAEEPGAEPSPAQVAPVAPAQ